MDVQELLTKFQNEIEREESNLISEYTDFGQAYDEVGEPRRDPENRPRKIQVRINKGKERLATLRNVVREIESMERTV